MKTAPQLKKQIVNKLVSIFGSANTLTSAPDCIAYSYDNSKLQAMPQAVVFATETPQIVALVKLCNQENMALIARGSGTGTTGATVPTHHGIVLSFEKMNKIISIDRENRLARVQPGVRNQDLQDALAEQGFFWPPDPTSAAICTIGGNLAYNSAGPRAVKYGTPRENTLGLKAVTGTGTEITTGTNTTKGVVGYDLTRLLIGSEGTLAIITEATLKLTPLQPEKRTIKAIYDDIHGAAQAVADIMAQPIMPCALEFMDKAAIDVVKDNKDLNLPDGAGAILMIEVDGQPDSIQQSTDSIQQVANNSHCLESLVASTAEQIKNLWQVRKSLSPALRNIAPKKINEDVVVPVSHIPELIKGLELIANRFGIKIVNFGHAGNGNIHVNLMYDPQDPAQQQAAEPCLAAVFDLVLKLDGTLSGEHGVGLVKKDFIHQEIDDPTLQIMQKIRQQFDPANILNPGKTLPD